MLIYDKNIPKRDINSADTSEYLLVLGGDFSF